MEGARSGVRDTVYERPCDPDDIFRVVSRLYYDHKMFPLHLHVMGEYGYLERFPDPEYDDEVIDYVIWVDAFDALEPTLIEKGIVE